jgi:alkylresorcinol/alkylpyrone synthase
MVVDHLFFDMTFVVAALSLAYIVGILVNRYRRRPHHHNVLQEKASGVVYMNGIASSFPKNSYRQSQMREMFIQNYCGGQANLLEKDFDFINRVFCAASIETCYVQLPENRLFSRMARDEYTRYVKSTMLTMACEAARAVMANIAGFNPQQITHIVFGTMTATIAAPSMDVCLAQALGLKTSVKRLNVEAMGCLTGFRLVGLCRDMALQSEDNVVLLIVSDVRSALGHQMTPFNPQEPIDKSNVIVAALFRDSCGAAIFSQKPNERGNNCSVIDHRTSMIPNTFELGRLCEFADSSIHLYLDKQLPYAVFDHLPQLVHRLLDDHRINIALCQFAVHTGGPKIIRGVQQCLDLKDEQVCASWFVMKYCGNLSGSSNLVVVEHFYRWRSSSSKPSCSDVVFPDDLSQYQYIIGLSFGPGIGVECVLFELE